MIRKAPLIVSLLLGVWATGCVDDYGSFYISHALPVAEGCTTPPPQAGGTGTFLSGGILDVSLKRGYTMFPQVENHMTSGSTTAGIETNHIALREFRITLNLGDVGGSYPENLTKFAEKTSGVILPAGQVVTSITPISDALADGLSAAVRPPAKPTIIAEIRAMGVRTGSELETAPFAFPIQLCNGCLVDLQAVCPDPKSTTVPVYANACGWPQDSAVTCCKNASGNVVCLTTADTGS